MTKVYFIRHAQSDNAVRDGRIRPLTEKGLHDSRLVTKYLSDKSVDIIFSSPFKRAADTLADFADKTKLKINFIEDFRERKSDRDMGRDNIDFIPFMERQWADFHYTYSDGECLAEVQERNIAALNELLIQYEGKNIVIGTHGTALSTIIHYYDSTYGYNEFMDMLDIMPWAVKMSFEGNHCVDIEKINLHALSFNTLSQLKH